jgi:tRNA(Met) C34 N-acetyltransferase TmcA
MVALLVSIYNMHTGGRRISRLVVHPSYRGCGIGKMLVKFYIHDYPDTDVVAAMGLYNPVFSRAGMVRTKDVNIKPPTGLKKSLSSFGFDETRWHDKKYLSQFVSNNDVRNALASYSKKATSLVCPAGHYLRDSEIKRKIKDEPYTAARVLFGLRPRVMAKYEVAAGE